MFDDLPGLEPVKGVPGIDFVLKSTDNDGKYVVDEVIKMSEQTALNDHDHEHVPVLDGDIMGDTVSIGCDLCPVGWYVPIPEAEAMGFTVIRS